MKIGIIGYGSMGRMLLEKFAASGKIENGDLYVANRTYEKIAHLENQYCVCRSNAELAVMADMIFICVRPAEIRPVLEEIMPVVKEDALLVSLNGSVTFGMMEQVIVHKLAKAIPSVTAEVNQSQTLLCCNHMVADRDKEMLVSLLECFGDVIELPEDEMGMGSELVSCMPGFIASIFDVIKQSAMKHTAIPEAQIVQMLLRTVVGTGKLMLEKDFSFEQVVERVATKGGITEEGKKVIYERLPEVADELFDKTLEKRRQTAKTARESFCTDFFMNREDYKGGFQQ